MKANLNIFYAFLVIIKQQLIQNSQRLANFVYLPFIQMTETKTAWQHTI